MNRRFSGKTGRRAAVLASTDWLSERSSGPAKRQPDTRYHLALSATKALCSRCTPASVTLTLGTAEHEERDVYRLLACRGLCRQFVQPGTAAGGRHS